MTFPRTPLDITTELFLDGQWVDVSGDVYNRDPVQITYGRADEASHADPKSCTLTLSNRDGKYSPRNPRSPLYGKLGRNTPIRVSVTGGESYGALDGSLDGFFSTPYDPAMYPGGRNLDVRIEASLDWQNQSLSQSLIGVWDDVNNQRSWILRLWQGYIRLEFSVDGKLMDGDVSSIGWWTARLPALPRRAAVRATVEADTTTVTFYWAESLEGPWNQLYEPINIGVVTPFAATAPLQVGLADRETTPVIRHPFIGSAHRAQVFVDGELVAAPDWRHLSPETRSFTDAAGRTWSASGTAGVSNRHVRFEGEVSSWPASWTPNGGDSWINIQASGLSRRLGQRAKPLTSALTRRVTSFDPVAYWPFEEAEGADRAWSPIDGVRYADAKGFQFGGDSPPGSAPLPTLGPGSYLNALVPYHTGGDFWAVSWVMMLPEVPEKEIPIIRVSSSGSATNHDLFIGPSGMTLRGSGPKTAENFAEQETKYEYTSNPTSQAFKDLAGQWVRMRLRAILPPLSESEYPRMEIQWAPISTGVAWRAWANFSTPRSQWKAGAVSRIYCSYDAATPSIGFGHLAVLTREEQYTAFDFADHGYTGELGDKRMLRVAQESGVPIQVNAPEGMPAMGPQRPMTFLDTLGDIATVDGGILAESTEDRALMYRARSTVYNQAPRMRLTINQVAPPLLPVDDDQHLVNDATVSRPGGGRASAVVESGPMSVQDPPEGVGRYDATAEVNAASDDQLQPYADWMVHTGTWDQSRYPTVRLNLRANPELIPDVLRLQLLDRIVITDPPDWLPPDPIDVLVQGWTETLTLTTWDLELNCTPYGPWDVGAMAGQEIREAFEDSTPLIPWTDGGAAPWTRTTTSPHSGSYCLRSGVISHNQTSDAVFTIPPNAVTFSAWYRTSSEQSAPGYRGDRLTIYADDQEVRWVAGTTAWATITLDVRTVSTVTFRYSKDNSVSAGDDAAYIDDVVLTVLDPEVTAYRADTDGSVLHLPVDETSTEYHVTVTDGPLWTTDPDQFPIPVTIGGEHMTALSIADSVADSFDRTEADGWGLADSGDPWTPVFGNPAEYSVSDGAGTITLDPAYATQPELRGMELLYDYGNVEVLVCLSTDMLPPAGTNQLVGVYSNGITLNDEPRFYWTNAAIQSTGQVFLQVRDVVTLVGSSVPTSLTISPGSKFWLRSRTDNHRVRARVWADGQREPAGWQIDRTVTAPTSDTGSVGIFAAATDTTQVPTFSVHEYRMVNPQTFTVVRGDLVMPHPAGSLVHVTNPLRIAW